MEPDKDNSNSESRGSGSNGPVGQGDYVVQQGDCIESIAYNYGFFWKTLWNLSENSELKRIRKNPNILLKGDHVFIPSLRKKSEDCSSEARHRFRMKGVPSKLNVQFLRRGKPRAGTGYRLELGGNVVEGKTDANGWIRLSIPPNSEGGVIIIGQGIDKQTISLSLGEMDPITTTIGVQKRLSNLGYSCMLSGFMDDETRSALGMFQEDNEIDSTGDVDQKSLDKLQKIHGS